MSPRGHRALLDILCCGYRPGYTTGSIQHSASLVMYRSCQAASTAGKENQGEDRISFQAVPICQHRYSEQSQARCPSSTQRLSALETELTSQADVRPRPKYCACLSLRKSVDPEVSKRLFGQLSRRMVLQPKGHGDSSCTPGDHSPSCRSY